MPDNTRVYATKEINNHYVAEHTTDYTLRANTKDMWATFTNVGATALLTLSLPKSAIGMGFKFLVSEAFAIRIDPFSTETIAGLNGVQGVAGDYLYSEIPGSYIEVKCDKAGAWNIRRPVGDWYHSGSQFNLPITEDYDVLNNASSNPVTVSLPAVATYSGRGVHVKCIDSTFAVDIDTNASEKIDNLDTLDLVQWDAPFIVPNNDKTGWLII